MGIKDNFNCNFRNIDFMEMVESFKILTEYSVFLIEKKYFNETFDFYNFLFEKNFPDSDVSLDNIDYKKLFVGKYAQEMTDIYQRLLVIWMELQEEKFLPEKDILKLRFIGKKIDRLLSNYK